MLGPAPIPPDVRRPGRNRRIKQGVREFLAPYAYISPFFVLFL
ncbi:ABC transporter permease, partial [Micromonospora sp. TSRI0369]